MTVEEAYIIVARHGERLDYVTRDSGGNWTASADRPFDSPLTAHGKEQAFKLGQHVAKEMKRLGIPSISDIYSSPLWRCRQTAAGVLRGISTTEPGLDCPSHVKVELGLAESINESWYRSWALPGSDGTWGYKPPGVKRKDHVIDPETLHPLAKSPVQPLLDWKAHAKAEADEDSSLLDFSYQSSTSLETPYCFHPPLMESRDDQRRRMFQAVEAVGKPGKTILLVSHGGPVTHLYEELTGNPWHVHGESSYCCYSIYKRKTHATGIDWEVLAVNEKDYLHEKAVTECHV